MHVHYVLRKKKKNSLLCSDRVVQQVSAKDAVKEEQGQSNSKVPCRLCSSCESEGSERAKKMLSCKSCSKKYHRSCLKAWSRNRGTFEAERTCDGMLVCFLINCLLQIFFTGVLGLVPLVEFVR